MFCHYFLYVRQIIGLLVKYASQMRKLWLMLLIIISVPAFAKTYYVSTTGDDNNVGSLAQPWATLTKGISVAIAGDTVFIRGGIYNLTSKYGITIASRSGTASDPICFFAYPPDYEAGNIPIFDCSGYPKDVTYLFGMRILWVQHIHIKGLEIRNMAQRNPGGLNTGIHIEGSKHITLENMVVHNVGGYGNVVYISDDVLYENCDAYDLVDPYGENPGNDGDGFLWNFGNDNPDSSKFHKVTYRGCRVWDFGDNGFAGFGGQVEIDNCWAFSGGRLEGAGCGLKYSIGVGTDETNPNARLVKNSIFACNGFYGISPNNNGGNGINGQFYNNFLYHNGYRLNSPERDKGFGYGLLFFYCEFCTPGGPQYEIFSNNLAYDNERGDVFDYSNQYLYNHRNNSWDLPGLIVDREDFVSLDTLELRSPRKSDGSLPDINFGRLKSTSDLIDMGIDVGIDFNGTAPDLGWIETASGSSAPVIPTVPVYINSAIENSTKAQIEITYNLALANIVPAPATFNVTINGSVRTVSSVAISGVKVLLTLSNPVVYGDVVTVAYTKPSSNPLQTPSGGQAASFAAQNVINNVAVVNPVYLSSVIESATPSRLEMTFDLTLANIVPAASAFSVIVNSSARSVTSVAISGTKVLLTLASPVVHGDVVTVAYNKPASNPLQTASGVQAASLSAQNVINNIAAVNQPPIISLSSPTKSTAYTEPATITIDASAGDPDGTVTKVEFYNGATRLGEKTLAPYSYTWKEVPAGTYTITASATDNKGLKTISSAVTVVVEKSATITNQVPFVSIKTRDNKKPKKNDNIVIVVEATDPDGSISKVELKSGSISIVEMTSAPYVYTLQNVDTGTYSITAIATDNLGAVSISEVLEFEVEDMENSSSEIMSLYPNPNNGEFKVEIRTGNPTQERVLSVINIAGKTMYQINLAAEDNYKDIYLPELQSGTYILLIYNKGMILGTKMFVKN